LTSESTTCPSGRSSDRRPAVRGIFDGVHLAAQVGAPHRRAPSPGQEDVVRRRRPHGVADEGPALPGSGPEPPAPIVVGAVLAPHAGHRSRVVVRRTIRWPPTQTHSALGRPARLHWDDRRALDHASEHQASRGASPGRVPRPEVVRRREDPRLAARGRGRRHGPRRGHPIAQGRAGGGPRVECRAADNPSDRPEAVLVATTLDLAAVPRDWPIGPGGSGS
jgi:hypothetical protein